MNDCCKDAISQTSAQASLIHTIAPRISRKDAPSYLMKVYGIRISSQTLAKYAVYGQGPQYQKFGGRVYYIVEELNLWAEMQLGPVRKNSSRQ